MRAGVAAGDPSLASEPAFSARTRLLVVAPHPDDETIATGLLIQRVRAAGGEVRILMLTAGDNNPWPQRWLERRLWIGAAARRRWGLRRREEVRHALHHLDVPEQAMQLLGWPDMGVTDALLQRGEWLVAALADVLDRFMPDLVALPGLADRHPDHAAAHVSVRLALAGRAMQPQLLTYLIHGREVPGRQLGIAGTTGQLANKSAALAAHRSQMALSGGRMRRLAARPERYGVTLPEAVGLLPWQPSPWLQPWLRLSVVGVAGARSWRWRDAPLRREPDGRFRLRPDAGIGEPRFVRLASTLPSPWIFDHWGWCELR